jgi:hypothetical protein
MSASEVNDFVRRFCPSVVSKDGCANVVTHSSAGVAESGLRGKRESE